MLPTAQARGPIPSLDLQSRGARRAAWEQRRDLQPLASRRTLGYTVDSLVDGAYAGDYFLQGGEKIDVTIVGQPAKTQTRACRT